MLMLGGCLCLYEFEGGFFSYLEGSLVGMLLFGRIWIH